MTNQNLINTLANRIFTLRGLLLEQLALEVPTQDIVAIKKDIKDLEKEIENLLLNQ